MGWGLEELMNLPFDERITWCKWLIADRKAEVAAAEQANADLRRGRL